MKAISLQLRNQSTVKLFNQNIYILVILLENTGLVSIAMLKILNYISQQDQMKLLNYLS